MRIEAIIKIVGDEKSHISESTGNLWKGRMLLIEWTDLEDTQRVWAVVSNERLKKFEERNIKQGDTCLVDLNFSTYTYRSQYKKTDISVEDIQKISDSEAGKGVAL